MSRDLSGLIRKLAEEKKRDDVAKWLDELCERATRVSRGTHGPKFTNSGIPNAGIVATIEAKDPGSLGTHSLDAPSIDTFCNAADLGVGVLLDLSEGTESLARQIAAGDSVSLRSFSDDEARVGRWIAGLVTALSDRPYIAHALTKQLYFPVGDGYHLISPQHATSLTQAVHTAIREAKFSESAKAARAARRESKHHEQDIIDYPRLATMKFGGAQPQNVSLLNSRRRGNAYLLTCAPPKWRDDRLRLPTQGENAFWRLYARRVTTTVRALRHFLPAVENINNVRIRNRRAAYIDELVDELLNLAAGIRRTGAAGWSRESDLPLSEQCFLDPERRDEDDTRFAQMRETGEWKRELSDSFGRFVNGRLTKMKARGGGHLRDLGQAEADVWSRELRNTLSYLRDQLELLA